MTEIPIKSRVMEKNDRIARENRASFRAQKIACINMIGSPGSGKTALLEALFKQHREAIRCAVIEGDVKTDNDMRRIAATGTPAVQIQTDGACHLNAEQVSKMLSELPLDEIELLIIENVGNLICPVSYDLGEDRRIIVISVAEGEDKPLKYPSAFISANAMVITKVDLVPYVDVRIETLISNARSLNPNLEIITTSAKTGEGIDRLKSFLQQVVSKHVSK